MTIARIKRSVIEKLLAPRAVSVIGAETPDGARVMANLREGGFRGVIDPPDGPPDLAVIACAAARVEGAMRALGAQGGCAAIVTAQVPNLADLVAATGVRALGPRSFGVAVPRLGLNASLAHMAVPKGNIALVTQSAALARSVLDWAGPNGVGFSYVVGVNGNANMGFAVIDYLARDPDTKLMLLDIRRVRSRRAFISAARAASRLRPVVALRPGGLLLDPSGRADAVFEAALHRAGVFAVHRLEAFLAAAETFSRAAPLRGETLAVVTNGIGPGRLAADAALEAGIRLAVLPPEAQAGLTSSLPADLVHGLIYAAGAVPTDLGSIAAMVSAVPSVGGVMVLLAPAGAGDAAAVESVIAAAHTARLPILTCVMGETTGAAHRRRLAEAGLPAFATPEQAVQAFGHMLRDRQARQAARELPPDRVLEVAPDHVAAEAAFAAARQAGRLSLSRSESFSALAAYGLQVAPAEAAGGEPEISVRVHEDEMFGPAIGCRVLPEGRPAYELPPLNLPLAAALARKAGLHEQALCDVAAQALVRVSQMVVDLPCVGAIGIDRLRLTPAGPVALDAAIWLRPEGERTVLAIPPYPEHLSENWRAGGEDLLIRPIRPEDAAAHTALIARVPAEDLRYRFFTALRTVTPEQMARLTQIDYEREMAFIAVRKRDEATVGVARLVREMDGGRGEFAILIQPDMKGCGLARHLMARLVDWAHEQRIPEIVGQVLADNAPMLAFMRRLGFSLRHDPGEPDVVEAVMRISPAKSRISEPAQK
jgi:acetyltransferase